MTVRLLAQARHDRPTLSLLFVTPLAIMALLYLLMRAGQPAAPSVDVVNQDQGRVGANVLSELEHQPLVRASLVSEAQEAEDDLNAGRIAGYVVLFADFSRRVQDEDVASPLVRLDASQPSNAKLILGAVSQAVTQALISAPGPGFQPKVSFAHGTAWLDPFDYFGGAFVALLLFFLVFTVTSISFLRERTQGTLERLLASPLRRSEIAIGYLIAFTAIGLIQATELLVFALWFLRVHNIGQAPLIFMLEVLVALSAVSLGIVISIMARNEFQVLQSIPIIIGPQLLLSGTIFQISTEPGWLQVLSRALPLTYAVDGLHQVMLKGMDLTSPQLQLDVAVLLAFGALIATLTGITLRYRV